MMALKIQPASPEEHAFAAQVNKRLAGIGAAVHAFALVNSEAPETRHYGLTFQCGSRRHTITADGPFHYDPVEDVVKRVQEWIGATGQAERWTTDSKYAEG